MLKAFTAIALASLVAAPIHPNKPAVAIVGVSVIPMDREHVLGDQTVVIRGDRIVAMGPAAQVKVPVGAERIDGRGKFLIPGLGDMHVHFVRDSASEASFRETEHRLLRYLASGVTTVRNMAGVPWHLTVREQAAKGQILSPRIYTSGPQIADLPDVAAAKAIVADQKATGYDFLKLYGGGPNLKREVFDSFVAAARRAGIRIVGHTPNSAEVGLKEMVQAGVGSIEHLSGYTYATMMLDFGGSSGFILPRGAWHVTDADISAFAEQTRRAGVWNCVTWAIMRRSTTDSELVRLHPKIIRALRDAGADLLLGTDDSPFYSPPTSVQDELEALVAAGLTPYQALETGTRNIAAFLGTSDSTGTVAVGKRADLVLLTGNPLQDIRQAAAVTGVVLSGQWLSRATLDARVAAAAAAYEKVKPSESDGD